MLYFSLIAYRYQIFLRGSLPEISFFHGLKDWNAFNEKNGFVLAQHVSLSDYNFDLQTAMWLHNRTCNLLLTINYDGSLNISSKLR